MVFCETKRGYADCLALERIFPCGKNKSSEATCSGRCLLWRRLFRGLRQSLPWCVVSAWEAFLQRGLVSKFLLVRWSLSPFVPALLLWSAALSSDPMLAMGKVRHFILRLSDHHKQHMNERSCHCRPTEVAPSCHFRNRACSYLGFG